MTNYSLRARMMILILAPTVLIGLLLSIFFVVHRYNDLQRQLGNDSNLLIVFYVQIMPDDFVNCLKKEQMVVSAIASTPQTAFPAL